jgi:hypothetical protein
MKTQAAISAFESDNAKNIKKKNSDNAGSDSSGPPYIYIIYMYNIIKYI